MFSLIKVVTYIDVKCTEVKWNVTQIWINALIKAKSTLAYCKTLPISIPSILYIVSPSFEHFIINISTIFKQLKQNYIEGIGVAKITRYEIHYISIYRLRFIVSNSAQNSDFKGRRESSMRYDGSSNVLASSGNNR